MSKTKLLRYLDMKNFKSISLLLATFSIGFANDHSIRHRWIDYYTITTIPLPEGEVIEVSGIDILPGNKVAIASRRGDIFVGEELGRWSTWNDFVCPRSSWNLRYFVERWLAICNQRPEVTRMKDRDGDGRADVFETVADDWHKCSTSMPWHPSR